MFTDQLAAAIKISPVRDLDGLAKILWRGHGAGTIDDGDAQRLAEALQRRRDVRPANPAPVLAGPPRPALAIPKAKPQRSPDKARSIARRRSLAASGPLPPALAANFTTGELAVLRVVGDEVAAKGLCDRSIAELAARAGVGMSTVRNAIRFAGRCGLLTVQERPRPGRKNLTNIVRVLSREWLAWLAVGRRRSASPAARPGIGFKKSESTATDISLRDKTGVWRPTFRPPIAENARRGR